MTKKIKKEVKIILTETTSHLGKVGNLIFVKAGYARNYLVPFNKGKLGTDSRLKLLEKKQKSLDLKEKLNFEICLKNKIFLEQLKQLTIYKRIGENNKIFGKVTLKQVRTEIENKINIDLSNAIIELPEIKEIGIFPITIMLHSNIKVNINLEILPQ
jgi:large subunit ribosomal protein L9|uniref:Large ribosomal subunit protein bL9c n=1 Tax=Vaucheria litorea TaxID=109269 RepID=B7T1U4_VAULI|nr:ribosomal protein L9 [Vaucheria litorea]ACF70910.1 ribosomal protein L9 [Vaucheria litorea]